MVIMPIVLIVIILAVVLTAGFSTGTSANQDNVARKSIAKGIQ